MNGTKAYARQGIFGISICAVVWLSACTPRLGLSERADAPTQTPAVIVVTATPQPQSNSVGAQPASFTSAAQQDWEDLYVRLYEQTSASVVHITTRTRVFDFFRGAVPSEGTGSGFFYNEQGHIVTNHHVIANAEEVEVILADGSTVRAKVIGDDVYNDLAVIQVDPQDKSVIRPLPMASAQQLKVGMRVIAIGNPFGLDRTLTTGVISALGRTIERDDQSALGEVIQTDAAINPGNSGGPLLNLKGQVIGVNTSIKTVAGGSVGIGFAVPADTVQRVVRELIEKGRYDHPWLGFAAYEINQELADAIKLPVARGLLIAQFYPDSPAQKAGVKGADQRLRTYGGDLLIGGDILTAIDGVPTPTRDAMTIYLENNKRVGDSVDLVLIREGQPLTLTATLEARTQ